VTYHFDSKAEIEQYICNSNILAAFMPLAVFMSNSLMNFMDFDTQGYTYTFAWPVNPKIAQIPLFAAGADTDMSMLLLLPTRVVNRCL
jgi:hypothetical protein